MDFAAVQYYLNDLPPNFKRHGPTFQWWQNSLGAGITQWTSAIDGVMTQVSFDAARWTWLDLWGRLYGVVRHNNETDSSYRVNIQNTILSRGATPVTLKYYMQWNYGIPVTITEDFTNASWLLNLQRPISTVGFSSVAAAYEALALGFGRFRPAGVPFTPFSIAAGGNYLSTVNFLGKSRVPGSWLTSATTEQTFSLPDGTTNSVPNIPTMFLTDPTINPGLAIAPVPVPLSVFSTPNSTPPTATAFGTDAYTNFTIVSLDPNKTLGGTVNDKAFNLTNRLLYICTTTGSISTAVWTPVDEVVGALP